MVIIVNVKAKRIIVQINVTKRMQYFGMVWESDIYYHNSGNYGRPSQERLTGDTIDISD